jgi:hypothetical protein
MTERFQILLKFLDRYGDEVQGREVSDPTGEAKRKFERLARGTLPEHEQAEVFAMLDREPRWVAWLAREVKSLRGND